MVHARIGKNFIVGWLLLSGALQATTDIQLRVVSEQGQPISTIPADFPCMVEVTVPATVSLQNKPFIDGIPAHAVLREQESTHISVVNGATTRQHTFGYLVSFTTIGKMSLGPAHVQTAQGELLSNVVTLEVTDSAAVPEQTQKIVFVEVELAQKSVYVHEAVPYTIRFYYSDPAINHVTMQPWSIPSVHQMVSDAVERGTTTIHDVACHYVARTGVFYPEKSGNLHIPAVVCEYSEPVVAAHMQHHWAQFMQLFAPVATQRHVRSAQTMVHVKPLPPTQEQSAGVGTDISVHASYAADTVQQGESVVCTITVTGNFDAQALTLPPLVVPDTVRVYESKVSTSGSYPHLTKTYEYIVQGLTAGTTTIPNQRYVFFDPQQEMYRVHTVPAQMLYIMPVAQPVKQAQATTPAQSLEEIPAPEVVLPAPVQQTQPPFLLPLWLYLVLLAVPVGWVATRHSIRQLYGMVQRKRARKQAFVMLRKKLQAAANRHDARACLHLWKDFLHQMIPAHYHAQDATGASYVQKLGATEQEIQQWCAVEQAFAEQAFSAVRGRGLTALVRQADEALMMLQRMMQRRGEL